MSEVSPEGICPTARFGAWPSLLSQNCKDGCRGLPESARGEKPKGANSVLIAFWNVLRPTINELFQRASHENQPTQLFVLEPERDGPLSDVGDTTLRDGWPPYVATGVSQEMLFRLEGLNLDAPPTILLLDEHLFHLGDVHIHTKLTRS